MEDFEEEEKERHNPVAPHPSTSSNPSPVTPSFPVFSPPDDNEDKEALSQEFVDGMAKLLEELTKGKEGEEGDNPTDFAKVVEDLEKNLEQSPEFTGVMETLVDQLISKEVLYEPMLEMKGKVIMIIILIPAAHSLFLFVMTAHWVFDSPSLLIVSGLLG